MSGFDINQLLKTEGIEAQVKSSRLHEIPLEKIQTNTKNFYPIELITELASSIEDHGLLTPVAVFEMENGMYRLVSGHQRLQAHKLLELPTIPSIIVEREEGLNDKLAEADETLLVITGNFQREKTTEIILEEVRNCNDIFELYKQEGRIDTGTLKRDWIGKQIGKTGRTVQNYLKQIEEESENEEELSIKKPKPSPTKQIVSKFHKFYANEIESLINNAHSYQFTEAEKRHLMNTFNGIKTAMKTLIDEFSNE